MDQMQTPAMPARANEAGGWHERLGFEVADQLDAPLVVVDLRLDLVWANRAARARSGPVWSALFGPERRTRCELALRAQLQDLVLACATHGGTGEAMVEGHGGPWFATAAALHGRAGLALLRLTALHEPPAGAAERLHRLFGLSAAEAQITTQLASGCSLEVIAAGRGVSVGTVRAQMRSVFHKTGMHRQSELICAVGRLAS